MSRDPIRSKVRKHGWALVNVKARQGETGPDWTYTVGLGESYQHPELVVVGIDERTTDFLLNQAGALVKGGQRFVAGRRYEGISQAPFTCGFKMIDRSLHEAFLGLGCRYYGGPSLFECLQMFVPDRADLLPWEEGVDPGSQGCQVDLERLVRQGMS